MLIENTEIRYGYVFSIYQFRRQREHSEYNWKHRILKLS